MFDADLAQLRALLLRIVTAEPQTPEQRERLNAAYNGVVQAIAALEQVQLDPPFQVRTDSVADLYEAIAQEERLKELG